MLKSINTLLVVCQTSEGALDTERRIACQALIIIIIIIIIMIIIMIIIIIIIFLMRPRHVI